MPKAGQLYAGLTPSERKRFAVQMKSHKRNNLQLLFNYIVKEFNQHGGHFSKEKAFAQTFGRAYSAEEDYLLRHELRLLVSEIYAFLRESEISTECVTDVNFSDTMLLRGLFKRKCFEEVEHLFPKFYASSIERLNFEQARRQADIYFQYLVFHREITPEILEQARSVMFEQIRILKILYRTGFALNQNNRAMCEAMLTMANRPVQNSVSCTIDTDFSDAETPYIQYITAILQSYIEPSIPKRIELVRQSSENITKVQHIYKTEKLLALGTLGTLHYMSGEYTSARKVFEEALSYSREFSLPQTINTVELLYNYVGTLMRLELYDTALEVMEEYRKIIISHVKLALRFAGFRCFCYIFLGKPSEAFAAIPHESTHHIEYEHLYFRFIYVIIPYLNGDTETAHRESVNLQDYFDRHKETMSFPDQQFAASFLRRFFAAQLSAPDKVKQKLEHLFIEFEVYLGQNNGTSTLFLMIWLRREFERKVR